MAEALTLLVDGMKCGGCEANITNKLKTLAGVATVTADRTTKEVKVEYDGSVTGRDAIAQGIVDAGYKVIQ